MTFGFLSNLGNNFLASKVTPTTTSNVNGLDVRSIGTLLLWLDATDSSTITSSSGNVTSWNDKSANGYNFITYGTSPKTGTISINSLNTIDFTANNGNSGLQNTTIPFGTSYTIFVVGKTNNTNNFSRLFNGSNGDGMLFFGGYLGKFATFVGNNNSWNDTNANSPSTSITSTTVMSFTTNNTSTGLLPYINGIRMTAKNGSTGTFTGLYLGNWFSPQLWNGPVGEIIVYNSVLSSTDRQMVEGYLSWKWEKPTSLPSNHPYYTSPPKYVVTTDLVIHLNSTVGIAGNTWSDQTSNGYNYNLYNSSNTIINLTSSMINGYNAVSLDGDSYLWRNNVSGFGTNFKSSFTYEMWVYPTSTINATLIYENGQNGFGGWSDDQLGISSAGYFTSYVYNGGLIATGNAASAYTLNRWYQVANVYDNTAKVLYQYINGVLTAQTNITKSYPGTVWLVLGGKAGNKSSFMSGLGYFLGYMGSFRGYNIALSIDQVLQNYNYAIDAAGYQFRLSNNSSGSVPTIDNTAVYTIINTGSVAMVNDTTRGYVFNLTGANYLSFTYASPQNVSRTFWTKSSTRSTSSGNNFSSNMWPIWYSGTNYMNSSTAFSGGGGTIITDPTDEGTGWVFFAVALSATTHTMYVNGILTPRVTSSNGTWSGEASNTIWIGSFQGANYFTGYLDDLRIYNRTLTAEEAKTIYLAGLK